MHASAEIEETMNGWVVTLRAGSDCTRWVFTDPVQAIQKVAECVACGRLAVTAAPALGKRDE